LSAFINNYLKPVLLGLLAIGALIAFFAGGQREVPPQTGTMQNFILNQRVKPAPPIPFRDADGNEKVVSDFQGQVLLINFWATWCAPCIRELPSIAALHDAEAGRRFKVLAISADFNGAKVAAPFLQKLGLEKLPLYLDPEMEFARAVGVKSLPTTILIDRRGNITGHLVGIAEWDSAEAKALIDFYKQR
tara:strand:+ start:331 stop:900 length:570 start_codon:yes stop_codon:yes gene_type:complete